VFVTGHEELSGEYVISPDGKYVQPLIGTLTVSGLSVTDVEQQVRTKLAIYITEPRVSVTLKAARQLRVNVIGEVKAPGQFSIEADESVLDLLSRAGGLTDFADETAIYLVRRATGERIRFRYDDLTSPDLTLTFRLQDGDSVIAQ
jgi:polysaccharide export outer membrane protein